MVWCRIISLSVLVVAGIRIAQAQPVEFACPKNGTVEQRGVYKIQYTGALPSNKQVCGSVDTWNEPHALLFNFFGMEAVKGTPVQSAMQDLLAELKTSVSFTLGAGSKETWTVLRHEPVTIEGKQIETIFFEEERERVPASTHPFHGRYLRWLDPKNGLWVKATLQVISGETAREGKPYEDTSLVIP